MTSTLLRELVVLMGTNIWNSLSYGECLYNIFSKCVRLENVPIDDVLPLTAVRSDAIANLKWLLGPRDTSDLISMVSFTSVSYTHLTLPTNREV